MSDEKTYRIVYTGYVQAVDLWDAISKCEKFDDLELTEVTELIEGWKTE